MVKRLEIEDLKDLLICNCGNIFIEENSRNMEEQDLDIYQCSSCSYHQINNDDLKKIKKIIKN